MTANIVERFIAFDCLCECIKQETRSCRNPVMLKTHVRNLSWFHDAKRELQSHMIKEFRRRSKTSNTFR